MLGLILAPGTFGAAPASLEGYIYYEHGNYSLGCFPTFEESASVFSADGTFQYIYARFNNSERSGAFNPPFVAPTQRRFTYRKIDEQTAELSFTNAGGFSHAGILRFDPAGGERGAFFDPSFNPAPNTVPTAVTSRTFRLAARGRPSPLVNCSNRSFVQPGGSALTGFVINGTEIV
ncbi:MAG: hypothetical protein H7343_09530 [Undibacterium sp.]|nr:hypothetical protein [Opitutaceae bacterium]